MDLGWEGSGQGGMDGLMKGQVVVEWEIDRQTAQVILRQPKNTLLWSSLSSAPQYGHWFHWATLIAHLAENSLW